MVRRFLSLEMRRQRGGSSRFWGEKDVVGEELEREKKTVLRQVAKWRGNRRVRGPGPGDRQR